MVRSPAFWRPPPQSWKSGEVPVHRDPLAILFDGEGCEIAVGQNRSVDARPAAKPWKIAQHRVPISTRSAGGCRSKALCPSQRSQVVEFLQFRQTDAQNLWREPASGRAHQWHDRSYLTFVPDTIDREPSSQSDVNVRPSAAALRRERVRNSVGRRTVGGYRADAVRAMRPACATVKN